VPELNFGSTDRDAITALKNFCSRVDADLYNHGKDGMKTVLASLVTAQATREALEDKRHRQNRDRLNIIIGILLLIATYITLAATLKKDGKSSLDPHKIFHSESQPALYSQKQPQESEIPKL
jgi:hypothetical protein